MPADNRVQAHPGRYLDALRADVRAGLTATPKTLPPKYFYDARGSELFDEITRLPEYYLTRAETSILQRARGGDRRAVAVRVAGRARQRHLGQDPAAAARAAGRRDAARVRSLRRRPGRARPRPATRSRPSTRACGSRRSSATSSSDLGRDPGRRPPHDRVPRLHHRQPRARSRGPAFLTPGRRRAAARRHLPARHRPGQGHRPAAARLRRRGRGDGGVQPQRARGRQPGARRRLCRRRSSSTSRVWDAANEWIEMRLRSAREQHVTIRDLGLTVSLRGGGGDAHRDLGQVPPRDGRGRAGRGRAGDGAVLD